MRLKIQHCINIARDTLPTLDFHSSAEVVKGPSAPAYKHRLTLQTQHQWRIHHTCLSLCTHNKLHTSPACVPLCVYIYICVCVAPVLPWQPAAVSLFVCPWSQEWTHTNAGAEIGTEGENDISQGFLSHLSSEQHPRLSHLLSPVKQKMQADRADTSTAGWWNVYPSCHAVFNCSLQSPSYQAAVFGSKHQLTSDHKELNTYISWK